MTARELAIPGAWEITPTLHPDDRGLFYEWFTEREFAEFTGHRLDLRQANCSVSAAGVLRGLHFAQLPPSQAKYVTCVRGAVFDVVVDIRVGSPTYGRWDSVLLDDRDRRSVYIVGGPGARFPCAGGRFDGHLPVLGRRTPRTASTPSCATDPQLAIDWPTVGGAAPRMSDRDRDAPTLDDVRAAGLLPTWDESRDFIERLRRGG